jgi:hypothetical protein
MITGAALPAAEVAGVAQRPLGYRLTPRGVAMDRRILARGRAGLEVPRVAELALVGVPLDRYGDRYAAVPRHTVPPSAAG